jgi:hypothetical protein
VAGSLFVMGTFDVEGLVRLNSLRIVVSCLAFKCVTIFGPGIVISRFQEVPGSIALPRTVNMRTQTGYEQSNDQETDWSERYIIRRSLA